MFNQEELKIAPKGKGLAKLCQKKGLIKKYRFSQEMLKVVPKGKKLCQEV
jgi:hypothetical protein